MSNTVRNSIVVHQTKSGDELGFRFETNKALWQGYNSETGAIAPDWAVPANQPTIIPKAFSSNLGADVAKISGQWSVNGVAITFDSNGVSTNFNGSYNLDLSTDALTIVKNIASSTNQNNDILTYAATWDNGYAETAGGTEYIVIDKIGTNPYNGIVNLTTNTLNETNGVTTATATAILLRGTTTMTSGFATKWYKQSDPNTVIGTSASLAIDRNMVDGKEIFFCEFYVDGVKQSVYYFSVYDMSDPAQIVFELKSASDRTTKTSNVEYYVKLVKSGSGTQISATAMTANFFNSRNRQFTPVSSGITLLAGVGTLVITHADGNLIDITDGLKHGSILTTITATY